MDCQHIETQEIYCLRCGGLIQVNCLNCNDLAPIPEWMNTPDRMCDCAEPYPENRNGEEYEHF